MKYRKWDSKPRAKIVLQELENKAPLAQLCNHCQITQGLYCCWLNEPQTKTCQIFDPENNIRKKLSPPRPLIRIGIKIPMLEQRLLRESRELKAIIAEITIEFKKTN